MKYRPDIDGLRAIAVIAVLVFHADPALLPGGFVGVDIFFVISGFLISTLVRDGLVKDGSHSIADFYQRRVKRIFPALAAVLATSMVVAWFVLFPDEYMQLCRHVMAGIGFVLNFVLWGESGYFDNAADTKPMLHLWSLAVEEQFYIVWPLLLGIAWAKRWRLVAVTAGLGLLSFCANVFMAQASPITAFYWPTNRFWELAMGAGAALFPGPRPHHRMATPLMHLQSGLGAALVALGLALIDRHKAFPGWWGVLPTGGALLLINAGPGAFVNRFLLARRWMVAIGLISYPLYLWHWPLLTLLRILKGGAPGHLAVAACLVVSGVLAWLTYAVLEKPIRRSHHPLIVPALLAVFAALLASAAIIVRADGLPQRGIAQQLTHFNNPDVFAGSRHSDGSCASRLHLNDVPAEAVCLANTSAPRILLAGDSHAMALFAAIHAGSIQVPAALLSAHGCHLYPALSYSPSYQPNTDSVCPALARQVLSLAERTQSMDVVVLATHYPPLDDLPSAYKLGAERLSNAQAFMYGLDPLIKGLLGAGKKVVFLVDVPYLKKDPRNCEQRLPFIKPQDCRYSRAQHDALRRNYLEAVRQLQAEHPGMRVYDPTSFFCPTDMCEDKQGGRLLYNDANHISTDASRALLRRMRDDGVLDF